MAGVCGGCFGGQVNTSVGPVKLNVGGQTFTTSRGTIQRCGKLVELVSGAPGPDGCYFLDRDGRYFAEILNFCRDGPELFLAPLEEDARRVLQREAVYFGLKDLELLVRDTYCGARFPANEAERVKRLEGLQIMHTNEYDHHYDSITKLVSAVLDVPIALVSLVHSDHQWFKSRVGLEANQTSRNSSFCAFTFTPEDPTVAQMLVIHDAKSDSRTAANPLVTGEPFIGFYAGCPIITSDGIRLGALCAIDHVPRSISAAQAQVLVNLAQLSATEIEREDLLTMDDSSEAEMDNIPNRADFAMGPLRAERMREALDEAVLFVRVRLDTNDWPVLYGNRNFTELSGIRLTPAPRLSGRATASGVGMRHLRGEPRQELGLWDWLHLTGKGEKQLRSEIQAAWERPEANIFALQATVPAPSTTSAGYVPRGAGADHVRVACRFVPCELPLDVAAEAIRPVPQRDCSKPPGPPSLPGISENDRLYFVSLRVTDSTPTKAMNQSSASNSPSAHNALYSISEDASQDSASRRTPVAAPISNVSPAPTPLSSGKSKGSGNTVEAAQAIKPPRSPFQDVRLIRLVGQGSFGKVSYALWMGSPVAVKIIESKVTDKMRKFEPVFEAALSASIAHPNLVQTFKYSTRAKPVEDGMEMDALEPVVETWMVQEWCDLGTLHTLSQKLRGTKDAIMDIIDICLDIARAGSYLHSRGIIHGDLTANNVLIKTQVSRKGYVCKIADFGLARVLEGNNVDIVTTQLGTVTHMPPELFDVGKEVKLTTKADIYAAGILLFQALTGESPYAGLSAPQVVVQVMRGKKPQLPEDSPSILQEIFVRCTAVMPRERPTFDELVQIFASALAQQVQEQGAA